MPIPPAPEPARVHAYLTAHGWIPENPEPDDGVMFTYRELSDDGEPMTVLLPSSTEVVAYPLCIHDIIVTAAGMEERSEDEVRADILATPLPQPRSTVGRSDAPGEPAAPTAAETASKGA